MLTDHYYTLCPGVPETFPLLLDSDSSPEHCHLALSLPKKVICGSRSAAVLSQRTVIEFLSINILVVYFFDVHTSNRYFQC